MPRKVETPQGYVDRMIRESQARTMENLERSAKVLGEMKGETK